MTEKDDIKDEELLLIGTLSLEFSDGDKDKIRVLISKVQDWDYFARLANLHGVAALIYHNLEEYGFSIPTVPTGFLRNAFLKNLVSNTSKIAMLEEALDVLQKEQVKTVLLKGMALELTVYGNKGLRQMSDVDVLVRKEDRIKAFSALKANGYRPAPMKSALHKLIKYNMGKHLPALNRKGFSLELHHELFGTAGNRLTGMLIDTSVEMDLHGRKIYIPEPQILFLYLVRHLHTHELNNDSQLRLYADLAVMARNHMKEIMNSRLIELADEAGMNEALAGKLTILKEFFGIEIPIKPDEFINEWSTGDTVDRFIFFLRNPKGNAPAGSRNYRNIIREVPGLHRKIIFVLGDLFPTIEFMKQRYSCKSSLKALLYYPHRLGKLLWLVKSA